MTAKEYLSEYKWLLKRIKSKEEQIERLEAKAVYSSPKFTGGSNEKSDKVGNAVVTKDRLQEQLDDLLWEKSIIEKQIEQIEDQRQCIVLTELYIKCKKVEAVAKFMNYSERSVQYIHSAGLAAFEEKFPFIKTLQ